MLFLSALHFMFSQFLPPCYSYKEGCSIWEIWGIIFKKNVKYIIFQDTFFLKQQFIRWNEMSHCRANHFMIFLAYRTTRPSIRFHFVFVMAVEVNSALLFKSYDSHNSKKHLHSGKSQCIYKLITNWGILYKRNDRFTRQVRSMQHR